MIKNRQSQILLERNFQPFFFVVVKFESNFTLYFYIFCSERKTTKKSTKMFKQHLEMIGRNESPTKKAKFWQSYVRSLKGPTIFLFMNHNS